MGILTGLKAINKHQEDLAAKKAAREAQGDRVKTEWLRLKDQQSVKSKFLQELDADSPHYSKKNGLGFLVVEHSNPDNFKAKAACSLDAEGRCYGCERHEALQGTVGYEGGWRQKTRLYINALVDDGVNEPHVVIVSQGNGAKSITPTLIEYATETGSITNRHFKIKRNGGGFNDTSYLAMALGEDTSVNVEDYELFDLNEVVRQPSYDEQEAHYNWTPDNNPQPKAEVSEASVNAVW